MAQTNYTPISLYYSATATSVPTAGNLVAGELALNTADGKLFYKDSAGVVQVLATKGGVGSSTTTQVLYNSSGLVVGSAGLTFDGTNLATTGTATATRFIPSSSTVATNGMFLPAANTLGFSTASTEAMRIDSSNNLIVNSSSTIGTGGKLMVTSTTDTLYSQTSSSTAYAALILNVQNTAARLAAFQYGNTTAVGTITTNGTTTSYNVTSDYRLKENIVPLTGALAKILQLKPSTYNYKSKPEESIEGFIAHELQSVIPHAVTGDKDAVDADEKPIYQGVDASFLVPHLVSAIQEQQALIESLTTRLTALENK